LCCCSSVVQTGTPRPQAPLPAPGSGATDLCSKELAYSFAKRFCLPHRTRKFGVTRTTSAVGELCVPCIARLQSVQEHTTDGTFVGTWTSNIVRGISFCAWSSTIQAQRHVRHSIPHNTHLLSQIPTSLFRHGSSMRLFIPLLLLAPEVLLRNHVCKPRFPETGVIKLPEMRFHGEEKSFY
jgi:hypothetical protein